MHIKKLPGTEKVPGIAVLLRHRTLILNNENKVAEQNEILFKAAGVRPSNYFEAKVTTF